MKWDLSAFYQAINDPQIEKDLTFLAQIIEEYTSLIYRLENNIKQPAPIETVLEKQIEIDLTIDKISTFAHLAVSTDAKNQAGLTRVVLAEATRSEGWLPIYLAKELGYFKEEGLDPELVTYKDGPLALMGLLNGDA